MVLDIVKDKCYFSTLYFRKSKFKNWLTYNLELVVKVFAKDHYSMNIFPFGDVIEE
jgi:hypothetical protein